MSGVRFPAGLALQILQRGHPRKDFTCGEPLVDQWLATKALQHQEKHLSLTKVLCQASGHIVGFYTLAAGQVDFSELPRAIIKKLPRRALPVAVIAWFGIHTSHHGQGLGRLLLAQALRDCYDAGKALAFVAVILESISDVSKAFYLQCDFEEVPEDPNRLFLSFAKLEKMMAES